MSDTELSDGNLIEKVISACAHKAKFEHLSDDNKLQEGQRQLYRSIMENAHIAIALIDLDYKILIANKTIGDKFNRPVSELIGRECFREFEKREAICAHCPGKQAIATGEPAEAEGEGVCDDGSCFPVRIQAFPAIEPDGKVIGFVEIVEDITERKKAEQALSASELRYRTTLNSMSDAIHVVDADLKVVLMNDRFFQWTEELGIKVGYPIGRKINEVFPFLSDRICDEYHQVFKSGKVLTAEESNEIAGKRIITETRKIPIYESGRVVRVVTVIRDITKRKRAEEALRESEEKFRSLAEQSPNMIFINRKGKIIYANKKCEDVTGHKREELYSSDFIFLDLIAPESVDLIKDNFDRHLSGEEVQPYDYSLINKRGERIEVINASKLIRYEGEMAILGIVTDISERKQAEKKLLEDREQLKSLASQLSLTEERERREIATELHDRIGQSLVISKIKLDELRKSVSSEELTKTLDDVCNCLGQVIQDTRTLTFDLSSPILYELGFEAAVAEWLNEQIHEKYGINTEFEDDQQPKPLDNDIRVLLFRNVRELLINVVKHSNARNVKVSVSRADKWIIVTVEDNGVGFDPVEAASKAAERATFGLFSIRERLEQLEGHLEIESALNHGSRITMTAPLKCENIDDKARK